MLDVVVHDDPQHDSKPTSLLPWLNSIQQDVRKYHLTDALVMPMGPTGSTEDKDILTEHGSITDQNVLDFFNDARVEKIRGVQANGDPYDDTLLGANLASQLLEAKKIQNSKILFYKIKASIAPTHLKQILHELAGFNEDGTRLIAHLVQDSLNTASAAMRKTMSALSN